MPTPDYKHGIYGEVKSAIGAADSNQGTVPVYIGTLPVNRAAYINSAAVTEYVNKPMLISSYRDVNRLGLYSDDWAHFSLCEALYAHFMSGDAVGPIIVINMLNPSTQLDEDTETATVAMTKEGANYVGYLNDPLAVMDDIAITVSNSALTTGNYSLAYSGDSIKITITQSGFSAASVSVTYKKMSFALSDFSTSDFQTALDSMNYIEQITGRIPNILIAPYFSAVPEYHDLMIATATNLLAGKWNIIVLSDIPADTVTTVAAAISWKNTNSYNSVLDKLFWPAVSDGTKVIHLSVVAAYTMQNIDMNNGEIPYISPSNKVINYTSICDLSMNALYINENDANQLNEVGITSVIPMKGQLRIWGSHMSNYNYDNLSNIADEDKFDVCARMKCYLLNYLQYNYIDEIDETITRKDIDAIINSVQTWLDSLVNESQLLYAAITFDDETDFPNGDIYFSLEVTYPVIAKSITFKLMYTNQGLSVLSETEADFDEF